MIEDALLWALKSPSEDRTHFLFGTMHVQPAFASDLIQAVSPCLVRCEVLSCEANIEELAVRSDEIQTICRSPVPMSGYYSERHFRRMRKYLLRFTGMDLHSLNHLRPLFAQQMISEYMLNSERKISLDQLLWNAAGQNDIDRTGLESVDKQLKYIEEISLEQQFSMFRNWIRQLSKHRKHLRRVVEWYRRQDIRQLYHLSSKSLGRLRKLLIYERNQRMTDAFIRQSESNTVFGAVGAAHLYGYKGMLRLLKNAGFEPEAVSTEWDIGFDSS